MKVAFDVLGPVEPHLDGGLILLSLDLEILELLLKLSDFAREMLDLLRQVLIVDLEGRRLLGLALIGR